VSNSKPLPVRDLDREPTWGWTAKSLARGHFEALCVRLEAEHPLFSVTKVSQTRNWEVDDAWNEEWYADDEKRKAVA